MALSFNGSSQYLIQTPVTSSLNADGTGAITLAAWFYIPSALSADVAILALDNNDLGGGLGRYILMAAKSQNVLGLSGNNTSVPAASTSTTYSYATWSHAASVYSGTNNRSAFLNGGGKGTDTTSVTFNAVTKQITAAAVKYDIAYSLNPGQIAEAAIWNAALTDAEIASLAAGFTPNQIRPQSLQFYAPLVRNLVDVRGGRTITNVNSATVATHPRIIT